MAKTGFTRAGEGYRVSEYVETMIPFAFDFNEGNGATAVTYRIHVKAGTLVTEVATVVTTAFNATSPVLNIGDADDADGYLTNAIVALATAATATAPAVKVSSAQATVAYTAGKLYAVDDAILFAWTQGTGGTTGVLKGYVKMKQLTDGGVATAANAAV